jgi:hypothetical protein
MLRTHWGQLLKQEHVSASTADPDLGCSPQTLTLESAKHTRQAGHCPHEHWQAAEH